MGRIRFQTSTYLVRHKVDFNRSILIPRKKSPPLEAGFAVSIRWPA